MIDFTSPTETVKQNKSWWDDYSHRLEGMVLLSFWLLVSLVVLLNLIIALLTKSYDDVANNQDAVERFYLLQCVIDFSNDGYLSCLNCLPPPLNLVLIPFFPVLLYNKLMNSKK